ncbi:hypothetical protein pgond44_03338 [Psychroflexus gondwanensis ACAM 44]|uniref:Uncharacterized protein n=1 Tax=Psychroflexus gondwanensis ACAM 44 TaxID=1189619 RepID=N1X2E6_9FLAO|nr:hypothetical protein [Psychroflexus gondwanensis]EMY82238.1 hypothetical protein pgond44_03338 [Psychroflexus gondwanensis ACAM 44]
MAKIYLNEAPQTPSKTMKPSAKTVKSILDFSKAFTVVTYRDLQFESFQN